MTALFPALDPANYQRHAFHGPDRVWPESNCYSDLWIEILPALGLAPEAIFGFTVTQDFEGDHFTFFKPPLEDIETLFGIIVQETAIYDDVAGHVVTQLERGRLSLVEVDSYFLPDTRGLSYHISHGKTSVAFNRLDWAGRRVEYFHGPGYHVLEGDDFDGVFKGYGDQTTPFLPYTEIVKFPKIIASPSRAAVGDILMRHLARRPAQNPIRLFQAGVAAQAEAVAARDPGFFHLFAFNTLRQFGANFELLAGHIAWLEGHEDAPGVAAARRIAETGKSAQFQLARACARKKFDALPAALDPAVDAYDAVMAALDARWAPAAARA
jgi:hypothetical protein